VVVLAISAYGTSRAFHIADDSQAIVSLGRGLPALGFVGLAVGLCCVFVPTPLLAAAAGGLFGGVAGSLLALAAFVLAACVQVFAGRFGLRGSSVTSDRASAILERVTDVLANRSWLAVLTLRLFPGVPFAAANYLLGPSKVGVLTVGSATAVGALPRAIVYSVLGASLLSLRGGEAVVAVTALATTSIVGLVLARALWRKPVR
jgi:uncharacterized membrane protein YdjX (TVP38/TMEM64 family)